MNKLLVAAAVLGLAAGLSSAAQAQSGQWGGFHVGLNAGGVTGDVTEQSSFYTTAGGVFTPDPPFGPENRGINTSGFLGGAQVGYDWAIGSLLVGAEADFQGSTISGKRFFAGTDIGGNNVSEAQRLDVNWLSTVRARLGYEVFPRWMPYVTGGIAFASLKGTQGLIGNGVTYTTASTTTIRTGGAVGAGLDYAVTSNIDVGAQYLYAAFDKFGTQTISNPPNGFNRTTTFQTKLNIFRLTVNYRFGTPSAPPPETTVAAPPPAPPVQAVAPAKQMFIVFFEFDKSALTADGKKVVDAAAAAFKNGKSSIAISGYTDLTGTQQYNLALSKRRADVVKSALVKDGVPTPAINESWHGKENPRVPTNDGVREPQNRRVEIAM